MSKRTPKTQGIEWLYLSMASFNGSGYADKTSPGHYIASYRAYKRMKKDAYAVGMVDLEKETALEFASKLVDAAEPGHTPSENSLRKFRAYYNPDDVGHWL